MNVPEEVRQTQDSNADADGRAVVGGDLDFSVIIPVYRDWQRLGTCLAALAGQEISQDSFEIIIADNEPDQSHPVPDLPVNARIIKVREPGSYVARNAAVAVAKGRYLAFTDSDCVPRPDWLKNAKAGLESRRGNRIAGPIPIFREAGGHQLAYLYEFHTAFRQREIAEEGLSTTANMIVSRADFDKVGPFDTSLMSGGDYVWSRRAEQAGVPLVFREDVVVQHPARQSIRQILAKKRRTAGGEAVFKQTSIWRYARYRLIPRANAITFDRGFVSPVERAMLLGVLWLRNLHGCYAFAAVRLKLSKPNRT